MAACCAARAPANGISCGLEGMDFHIKSMFLLVLLVSANSTKTRMAIVSFIPSTQDSFKQYNALFSWRNISPFVCISLEQCCQKTFARGCFFDCLAHWLWNGTDSTKSSEFLMPCCGISVSRWFLLPPYTLEMNMILSVLRIALTTMPVATHFSRNNVFVILDNPQSVLWTVCFEKTSA